MAMRAIDSSALQELPPEAFSEAGVLHKELKSFFATGWTSIGLCSQVPRKGDVRPVEIAGQPLLITRDDDNEIHVFHNICRHRGLKLVDAHRTQRNKLITCPYHTWSYELNGDLRATPYWDRTAGSSPDEAVRKSLKLCPVRFAVWFDTIFVNLSGDAPGFDEFIKPLATRWASFDAAQLRLLTQTDYEPRANWKLVCENFLDGYHIPWVHSQVGPPEAGAAYESIKLSEDIFGAYIPHGEEERPRIDTPLPSFPGISDEFKGSHHFMYVFPNTMLALGSEWLMVISLTPEAPDSSREVLALYLVGDESMQDKLADQRRQFAGQMLQINDQDMEIVARMQAGRTGSAARRCTFAPYWDELAAIFHAKLAKELGDF